jgi:UDP-2,4-diacetamido-2,4,6-trideoxy-beta-L-altropyranose hydrolase
MNDSRTVLFRADGSYKVGMGHVMRCLALADFFVQAGWQAVFAFSPDVANKDVLAGRIVEYVTDAAATVDVARKFNADVLVIDMSYRENAEAPKEFGKQVWAMRESGPYVVIIDSTRNECITAKVDLAVDMVVLPYLSAGDQPLGLNTKVLAGKEFAIYQREYSRFDKIKRELPNEVRNILVTMGGSDPWGLTETTLEALSELDLNGTTISLIVGPAFSDKTKAACEKASSQFGGKLRLVESPPGLAEELLQADLAIINDGLTKYEAAVTGTPSIVLSYDQHQRSLSKDFSELGCYAPFGPEKIEDSKELARLIDSVRRDASLRRRMSEIGTREFDPRGGARVVQEIEKELRHV